LVVGYILHLAGQLKWQMATGFGWPLLESALGRKETYKQGFLLGKIPKDTHTPEVCYI
jgi:hypothetical protein